MDNWNKINTISFSREILSDIGTSRSLEWMVTNNIGGFASSSIIGMNTRRYHGLLVASFDPPVNRRVISNSIDETVVINGTAYELANHQYPGVVHPEGYQYLHRFEFIFHPYFIYRFGNTIITKSIWMEHGKNITYVQYKVTRSAHPVTFSLKPQLNHRDYHTLQKSGDNRFAISAEANLVTVKPDPDSPAEIFIGFTAGGINKDHPGADAGFDLSFSAKQEWYYNIEYDMEKRRGLDFSEDTCCIGSITATLQEGATVTVVISAEPKQLTRKMLNRAGKSLARFNAGKRQVIPTLANQPINRAYARLLLAADDFIVTRRSTGSKTIIAGYPWFADWGRDSMISLPGLTLATGRIGDAKEILYTFSTFIKNGLIPNMFPDGGEQPRYNTADATLWFFVALYKYYMATKDKKFIESLFSKLTDIIDFHHKGTLFGIKVDDDGLLKAGEENLQLTWMDAKVGDWVVTPRQGKPVEINALWINTVYIYDFFAKELKQKSGVSPDKARSVFRSRFWNEETNCLFDLVDSKGNDPSIRPNQLLALSLPFPLLGKVKGKKLLAVVEEKLLTPYGLRTLSPENSNYKPVYTGNQWQRDAAYHQGTVWPWLLGPYMMAILAVYGKNRGSKEKIKKLIQPLNDHLFQTGIGHISELFDGSVPHHPGGCPAQAWSIAAILETLKIISA